MIVSFAAARVGVTQRSGRGALPGFGPSGCEGDSEDDNSALDLRMFTSGDYEFTLELQLYLCVEATLGTEESGRCREVEAKVNVWTVRQTNGHCREGTVAGGSTVHRIIFTCYFYMYFSSGLHRKQ